MKSLDIPQNLAFSEAIHDLRKLTSDKNGIPPEHLQFKEITFHIVDQTADKTYSLGFQVSKDGADDRLREKVVAYKNDLLEHVANIHGVPPENLVFAGFTCVFTELTTGNELPTGAYTAEFVHEHGDPRMCYMDNTGKVRPWKKAVGEIECSA